SSLRETTSRVLSWSTAASTATGHVAMKCAPSSTRAATGVVSCRRSLKPPLRKDPAHDEHSAATPQAIPVSAHVRDPELEPVLLQARDLAAYCTDSLRGRRHARST